MAMAVVLWAAVHAAGVEYEAEAIFPPNPKHNHGSSVVETPEGDLLACWFHGSGERTADDVVIQGARRRAGKTAWGEPFLMADSQELPDCNPVLFVDPRGTLWLFWVAVLNNQWGGSLLKYRTSTDYAGDGPPRWAWQDVVCARPVHLEKNFIPVEAKDNILLQRLGWMTRLHPIMLSDSEMMLGLYSDVFNCSLAAFTKDRGETWEFSEPIVGLGNIQPSFVVKRDGTIVALMRDNGLPKHIRWAESADQGRTWSKVSSMEIPNPGSSVECIALRDGVWALVCNDTKKGRHRLTVYLSEDQGATWPFKRPLEDFPEEKSSASYPSLIQTKDGALHCTYSFTQEGVQGSCIKHARFSEDWIRSGS